MSTIDRFSSVRAKIGCRSVDQLPAMAEGVLGGISINLLTRWKKFLSGIL